MKAMKDMDISEFSKDQKKLVRRLSAMSPYEVVRAILEFYECPAECGARCCKMGDIPLILEDKKRIASKGQGYRKIIKEKTQFVQHTVNGELITEEVFTEHPCPFMKKERCSIHKFSPIICTLYPFKTTSKSSSLLEIVACRMGADIVTDFAAFELFMSMLSKSQAVNLQERVMEATTLVNTLMSVDTDELSGALVYGVNEFEKLRYFLMYLNNESKGSIIGRRNEIRVIAANNNPDANND